jgi:hypothetical protein
MTTGLMARFMTFSMTGSRGPSGGDGPQTSSLLWTNVAALPVHSYGMRMVVRGWCDLPDLPFCLPFVRVVSTIRYQTRSLLRASTVCDCGRHWLLEATWKRSTLTKSPRVHPNLPSARPGTALCTLPYPICSKLSFHLHLVVVPVSSSLMCSHRCTLQHIILVTSKHLR